MAVHVVHRAANEIIQTTNKCRPAIAGKDMSQLLYDLIATATPHGHEHLLFPIMGTALTPFTNLISFKHIDVMGNMYIRIGARKDSDTMFSCHMDTMHQAPPGDKNPPIIVPMIVDYDGGNQAHENHMIYGATTYFSKASGKNELMPSILGADDKVGVYILVRMIQAKIPGLYVFHVGEERGCVGSKWSSTNNQKVFKDYKRCIAFDRMNYGDIITSQRGRRTASKVFSEEFATSLNSGLSTKLQAFKPDVVGMYTDSANYTDLIPECTNVSVGYWDQHGAGEHFDLIWLEQILLPAILKVNYEKLITKRDVKDAGYSYPQHTWSNAHTVKRKPNEVNINTLYLDCPHWSIDDGLYEGIADAIMIRIIEARLKNSIYSDHIKLAKELFDFLKRYGPAIATAEEEECESQYVVKIEPTAIVPKKNVRAVRQKEPSAHDPNYPIGPAMLSKIKEIPADKYRDTLRLVKDLGIYVDIFLKLTGAYDRAGLHKAQSIMHVAVQERRIKLVNLIYNGLANKIPTDIDVSLVKWNLVDLAQLMSKLPKQGIPAYLKVEIEFVLMKYSVERKIEGA